jgi:hypothetical protein
MITSGCTTSAKHPDNRITAEHVKEFTRYYIDVMTAPYDGVLQLQYSSFNPARRFRLIKTYDPVWTFERWDNKVYFAHSEFESLDGEILLEIDFWLVSFGEKMRLTDIKIHKVNGEPWFTYDRYHVRRLR